MKLQCSELLINFRTTTFLRKSFPWIKPLLCLFWTYNKSWILVINMQRFVWGQYSETMKTRIRKEGNEVILTLYLHYLNWQHSEQNRWNWWNLMHRHCGNKLVQDYVFNDTYWSDFEILKSLFNIKRKTKNTPIHFIFMYTK